MTIILRLLNCFDSEISGEREVRRLRNSVSADDTVAFEAADRRHDNDRSTAALGHAGNGKVREPDVALDVRAHDFVEGFI